MSVFEPVNEAAKSEEASPASKIGQQQGCRMTREPPPTNYRQLRITLFKGTKANTGEEIEFSQVQQIIQQGDHPLWLRDEGEIGLAGATELLRKKLRQCRARGYSEEQIRDVAKTVKTYLPGVTWSGRFPLLRKADCLEEHSSVLVVDLDHLTEQEIAKLESKLAQDPHTLFEFLSPSGAGLKIGVPMSGIEQWVPQDGKLRQAEYAANANRFHLAAFFVIRKYFKERYGVAIDEACKDSSRLCFLASDAESRWNWKAVPLHVERNDQMDEEVSHSLEQDAVGKGKKRAKSVNEIPRQASRAPEEDPSANRSKSSETGKATPTGGNGEETRILEALKFIDYEDRARWLNVGFALKSWDPERGYALWADWASQSHKFDEAEHERAWNKAESDGGCKLATLFFLAREGGWSDFLKPSDWLAARFPGLAEKHGPALQEKCQVKDNEPLLRVLDLNESFLAATLGAGGSPNHPAVFSAVENKWFQYEEQRGIYAEVRQQLLEERLSALLLECAVACKNSSVDTSALEFKLRGTRRTSQVLRRASGLLAVNDSFWRRHDLMIPCANGILDLEQQELVPFSPKYHFRGTLGVDFRDDAECPQWDALLARALPQDDIELLKRWFGMLLLGRNMAQKLLMLIGTPQSGKGVICRMATALVGADNVGTLRTAQLAGRFEIARHQHKMLLYGADVKAQFLSEEGAHILKAITGRPLFPE